MAFVIYTGLAINNGVVPISNLPIIGQVLSGAPAEVSDLRPGDTIKAINGKKKYLRGKIWLQKFILVQTKVLI
ncbi:MAG: hypothetical protein Ct9H90mP20_4790 [Candidatus Neomarinimicrobiota bacterium]|nr:MAG: hypothetical protein Ct9H90mP20_4790 [Candidatus Neomarinimicrobiota bacterium]